MAKRFLAVVFSLLSLIGFFVLYQLYHYFIDPKFNYFTYRDLGWGVSILLAVFFFYLFWKRSDEAEPDCIQYFEPRGPEILKRENGEAQWSSDENWEVLKCGLWDALVFSATNALRIGWRDLNVGTWITAMHPRRRRFRALGWVRFVAGFQSVATVYLIGLSILTYFGHPFG